MNNAVKVDKLLAELKDNIAVAGRPEFENTTEGFVELCNYVTEWMLRKYELEFDDEINRGYCFIWAYLVYALWPYGGVTFKTVTGHVVVVRNGLYYDSEHMEGSVRLNEFCGFGHSRNTKHVNVNWMAWFWTRNGLELKEFRRLIRKIDPNLYKFVRDSGKHFWRNHDMFSGYEHISNLPEVT